MDSFFETASALYQHEWFWTVSLPLTLTFFYLLYYLRYSSPHFLITGDYDIKKKNLRKPPPPYPNGWYKLLNSSDLQKVCGRGHRRRCCPWTVLCTTLTGCVRGRAKSST